MFENPDFEVDREAEEYRLLNPVLSRLDKSKEKKVESEPVQVIIFIVFWNIHYESVVTTM